MINYGNFFTECGIIVLGFVMLYGTLAFVIQSGRWDQRINTCDKTAEQILCLRMMLLNVTVVVVVVGCVGATILIGSAITSMFMVGRYG